MEVGVFKKSDEKLNANPFEFQANKRNNIFWKEEPKKDETFKTVTEFERKRRMFFDTSNEYFKAKVEELNLETKMKTKMEAKTRSAAFKGRPNKKTFK